MKNADDGPSEHDLEVMRSMKRADDLAIGKKIGEMTAQVRAYQRFPTSRLRHVLAFLERIGGAGYGCESDYEIALATMRELVEARQS